MTTSTDLAHYIDHTLLAMDATEDAIKKLCTEAKKYHFYTVCVNSGYLPLVKQQLLTSEVKACAVVGFPLGAMLSQVKAFEAKAAIEAGADEIDMVLNVGWLKSNQWQQVEDDIATVLKTCGQTPLKVILETCLLNESQIIKACEICRQLKVAFVKTSTGFSTAGATVEHVALMRTTVGAHIGVKASGGVRDRQTAEKMIAAGATRIGTSSGIAIVSGDESHTKASY